MNQMRQGDVFFEKVDKLPAKLKKLNTNVIAYGEVTGHSHAIEVDAGDVTLVEDGEGNMYVCVKKGAKACVKHDEHGPIPLTEGNYKVTIQREFDPVKDRKVQD